MHGGWFTIFIGGILFSVMYVWFHGRKIKNSFIEFVKIENYYEVIKRPSQ